MQIHTFLCPRLNSAVLLLHALICMLYLLYRTQYMCVQCLVQQIIEQHINIIKYRTQVLIVVYILKINVRAWGMWSIPGGEVGVNQVKAFNVSLCIIGLYMTYKI